jgi:hypothetical protein
MAQDTESTRFTAAGASAGSPSRPRSWLWPWLAGIALLIVAAALAVSYHRGPVGPPTRTELTRLSPDDEYSDLGPAISREGKLVAYSSNRSGKWELWVQTLGGGPLTQLTHSDRVPGGPSFFPDGSRILYSTTSPSLDDTTIEIIPTAGGEPHKLWSGKIVTSAVDLRGPELSPDGSRVAFLERQTDGRLRLMVMSTTADRPRPVPGFDRLKPWPGESRNLSWTPDGRFVLHLAISTGDKPSWEWFAVPVDGGEPVGLGAGEALRRSGFEAVSPGVMVGSRAMFWGSFTMPNVFDVPLANDTWKVSGPPRQLTFGSGRFDPTSASASGVAALERPVTSIDFYTIPVDATTGQAAGPTRRLTKHGLGTAVFDVGGDPALSYVVTWESSPSGFGARAQRLRLDTAEAAPLASADANRVGSWIVSRDGRTIAHSRPESGGGYSISLGQADAPSERVVCEKCGLAQAFSPDGKYLLLQPEASSRPNVRKKTSIHLLDVTSGSRKAWLDDRADYLGVRGLTGVAGEWVIVSAITPGAQSKQARTFLVPWGTESVPRSEWIEVAGENLRFSPANNLAYFFEGVQLMAMRFDPKRKQMGAPFQVRLTPGSQPVLKPDDNWVVRGPGIVFSPTDIKSSIWLLTLAKD